MTSSSASTRSRKAILAASLRDLASSRPTADVLARWVGGLHRVVAEQVLRHGGAVVPCALDVAVGCFAHREAALQAAASLWRAVEALREPHDHRHGGVIGVAVTFGEVDERGGPFPIGVPHVRALRLVLDAARRGELLADDATLVERLPEGFGAFRARRERVERIGFPFYHLVPPPDE